MTSRADRLTIMQGAFCLEYVKDFNGTRAAERAGYTGTESSLASMASRLLRTVKVKTKVKDLVNDRCMGVDEALTHLAEQARFDIGPYLDFSDDYEVSPKVDFEKMRDDGLTIVIKSIVHTAHGVKVEFESRQGALDKILRAQGAYKDKLDVTTDGEKITLSVIYDKPDSPSEKPT